MIEIYWQSMIILEEILFIHAQLPVTLVIPIYTSLGSMFQPLDGKCIVERLASADGDQR